MKKKTIITTASLMVAATLLVACAPKEVAVEKTENEVVQKEKGAKPDVVKETKTSEQVSADEHMPPVPTAQEMTDVMKTFDSYEEYKGKLAEVGVVEPVTSLKDKVLAGDGVKEFKANVHFYKASDGYFALYEKEDAILNDFPESIVKHVWTEAEMKSFLEQNT